MTGNEVEQLELISAYLNESFRGQLGGKQALVASSMRSAYADGVRHTIKQILATYELRLRPAPAAPGAIAAEAPTQPAEVSGGV